MMGELIRSVRHAARGARRNPGFTLTAVLTLGLGIGATTTILSVVDGVVLRPLPWEEGHRLVAFGVTFPQREWVEGADGLQHLAGVSVPNAQYIGERTRTLEQLSGLQLASVLLPDVGEGPEIAAMARVTEDFFDLLGAGVELGRLFVPEEYGPTAGPPVLLSWSTWQTRFGGDPSVVGRSMPGVEGSASPVVVGVLARDFEIPESLASTPVEFWQPLDPGHPRFESRGSRSVAMIARLAPGATIAEARTELTALAAEIAETYPEGSVYPDGSHFGYGVNALRDHLVGTSGRPLLVFLGAAALLLLISAMNTANLLLVRTSDRTGELGIRRALGAGRGTLFGQVLAESVLISLAGGLLGVGVAWLGVESFLRWAPSLPRMDQVSVNVRIMILAASVSVGSGILVGLLPAGVATRRDPVKAMRPSARGVSAGSTRLRGALVTAQLGVALMLGIGASVLMHSFVRVASVDPGFSPEGLVSFRLATKRPGAPDVEWAAWDETLRAVAEEVTGLTSVAGTSNLPFEDPNWAPSLLFPGEAEEDMRVGIAGYAITPGYFSALGQEVVAGRGFEAADGPDGEPVVVVNRALAAREFADGDVVGSTVVVGEEGVARRVVGIVEDAVVRRAEEGPVPALYVPYTQQAWPWVKVVVRSDRDFSALAPDLRRAAATVSPVVPIQALGKLEDRISSTETEPRFQALLIGSFALAALLLAAVGLYGTLAHSVGRRRRELGIRMALGAEPERVVALVVRQAAAITGMGVVLGLAGAALVSGVLERFLFDVPALDPVGFAVGLGVLALATAAAVLRPAVRAGRVDVVQSLRTE